MLRSKKTFCELIRFGIVGVVATAIHYSVYWLLIHWIQVTIAYSIGYVVSFIGNFLLTSYFTFRKRATVKKGLGFGVAHGVNYLLHVLFLHLFLWLGVSKSMAPIPVFVIVIPMNFLLVRFVFKKM